MTPEVTEIANAGPGLKRQLGLVSAAAAVIGEVIGVGIFLTPAAMSKSIGSPAILACVWIVTGALSVCGALCYGELAARFPEAGGGYVYLREAFGPRVAFLYGWKCFLVMDPGLTAALAVGVASYAGYIFNLPALGSKAIAIGCILAISGFNILSLGLGAFVMRWMTALKLGLLLLVVCWALGFGLGDWSHFLPLVAQRPGSDPLGAALAGGLIAAFFSFGGWWDVSRLAGEIRDPQTIVPRALFFGILIVTLVYLATSAVFLYLVPIERVTSGETFAAQAGEVLFGKMGGVIFSVVVIVSVFGSLAAFMMAAPRLYYAMARDRLFVPMAARVHPRFGTPIAAIAIQSAVATALVLLGNFRSIVAYFIFITVAFVGLTIAGLFRIRRKGSTGSPYRVPGYPLTPATCVIAIVLLLVVLAVANPLQAVVGTAVVALGLPVFEYLRRTAPAAANHQRGGFDGPDEQERFTGGK